VGQRLLPLGASLGTAHSHASASCWRSPSWPSIQALVPAGSAAEARGRRGGTAVALLVLAVSQQAWPGATAFGMPSSARAAAMQCCWCGGSWSSSGRGGREGSGGGWESVGGTDRQVVDGTWQELESLWEETRHGSSFSEEPALKASITVQIAGTGTVGCPLTCSGACASCSLQHWRGSSAAAASMAVPASCCIAAGGMATAVAALGLATGVEPTLARDAVGPVRLTPAGFFSLNWRFQCRCTRLWVATLSQTRNSFAESEAAGRCRGRGQLEVHATGPPSLKMLAVCRLVGTWFPSEAPTCRSTEHSTVFNWGQTDARGLPLCLLPTPRASRDWPRGQSPLGAAILRRHAAPAISAQRPSTIWWLPAARWRATCSGLGAGSILPRRSRCRRRRLARAAAAAEAAPLAGKPPLLHYCSKYVF
jgi:hypothetical protein